MSENKKVVERYMEGFRRSDHEMILSCLTDDVVWDLPGAFHLEGKVAFDEGKDLTYTLAVEVLPKFEIKNFKGMKLQKLFAKPDDKSIDEALVRIAAGNAGSTRHAWRHNRRRV